MNRRSFLTGIICAPAIVRIDSIMPVKVFKQLTLDDWARMMRTIDPLIVTPHSILDDFDFTRIRTSIPYPAWRLLNYDVEIKK